MPVSEINWSEWLEFNLENINKTPTTSGIFRMHQNMKMMYIGNAKNIKEKLSQLLTEPCVCDSKRFCYFESQNHEKIKNEVLEEYKNRHDGKNPICM